MADSMWQGPAVRGTDTGHRQATWIELFFDLIFVVAIAQLSARLVENVSWGGVAGYAFVYLAIWLSWVYATFYSNRFDTDDLGQRVITFGQLLTVAAMAASVAEATPVQFAVAAAAYRLLVAVSYTRVRSSLPSAVALANRMIAVLVTSAGIWLASAFVEGRVRAAFWAVAMLVEIVVAFAPSSRERFAAVPLQLHHLPERFGLFTIIVLGETVLAVVVGVSHAHWAASAAFFGAVGLTISFSLWWIYFESVSARAFAYSEWFRPLTWVLAHAPFVISVTALGVGIEIAVLTEFGEQLPDADALLLSGSLVIALVAVAVLLMTGVPADQWGRLVLWRVPAIAAVLLIGQLPIAAQSVLVGLSLVAAVQAVVDVRTSRTSVPDTS